MSIVEKALERLHKTGTQASTAGSDPARASSSTREAEKKDPESVFLSHRRGRKGRKPQTVLSRPGLDLSEIPTETLLNLDIDKLKSEGVLAPEDNALQIADQYRRIKRPLLDAAFEGDGLAFPGSNTVLVTSAISGDGKTFNAMNLAFSMARELDRTVLLVDADVAKPHISTMLGVRDRPGLIDLLSSDEVRLSDVLLRTDYPGHLTLLPAGQRHSHATELLASRRMEDLVAELSERYQDRIIVLDSSPLLATPEAPVLASLVGQIVLVVQAGVTPQHAVREAIERIESDSVVSIVLNKNQFGSSADQYGGYGYGYYGRT